MLRVAVNGSTGRMGVELVELIQNSKDMKLAYAANKSNSIEEAITQNVDVVIDFSLPESFKKVFLWCEKNKIPLVSGTTGFEIEDFSEPHFPFAHSGNYSLGIASVLKSIEAYKTLMGENLKIWIEDYHHRKKLDSPSGTALKIKNELKRVFPNKTIEISDQRAGSIFGVHQIHFVTDNEWVTVKHQALNRALFAEGAIKVAGWLVNQKASLYSMEDYLNSNKG